MEAWAGIAAPSGRGPGRLRTGRALHVLSPPVRFHNRSIKKLDPLMRTECFLEAWAGIEPANKGFADPRLTTWLPGHGDAPMVPGARRIGHPQNPPIRPRRTFHMGDIS